jgi:hypothetical protein
VTLLIVLAVAVYLLTVRAADFSPRSDDGSGTE